MSTNEFRICYMIMTDKELKKIVTKFTKGILDGKPSKNMCFAVCLPLHSYLSICEQETELINGEIPIGDDIYQHTWLQLPDGRIIDPTADQFNALLDKKMPLIYIGQKPDWYKIKTITD